MAEPNKSKKINRTTYERLISEDIAWLMAQPRTLEREHIALVVRESVEQEYPPEPSGDLIERIGQERAFAKAQARTLIARLSPILAAKGHEIATLRARAERAEAKLARVAGITDAEIYQAWCGGDAGRYGLSNMSTRAVVELIRSRLSDGAEAPT
jgi:hypothetical protein